MVIGEECPIIDGVRYGVPGTHTIRESFKATARSTLVICQGTKARCVPVLDAVRWGAFTEFMFAIEYDIVLALGRIRRAGFVRHPDTLEGFHRRFDDYRRALIIPTF